MNESPSKGSMFRDWCNCNARMSVSRNYWSEVVVVCVVVAVKLLGTSANDDLYQIGVGIADITGPASQIEMMGYAVPKQTTAGIHTRLFSRAFIIGQSGHYIVFVSIDAGMISHYARTEIVKEIKNRFNGDERYNEANILISATHTHSGPAGYFQYFLYNIPSFGFVRSTFTVMVDGIVESIVRAHESIQNGYIYYNIGDLTNASINRSPMAYLQNSEEERQRYTTNVDTKMVLLKLTDVNGNPIGMINWFSVHGTSMNKSNHLISSDNKGYASLLFEQQINGQEVLPGKGKFVGAFAQSNEGDVSPNTAGPLCRDTGEECDSATTTCNGQSQQCIAFGPGRDMFESTKIIAERQFKFAWDLWNSAVQRISGPVKFIYQRVDMSNYVVNLSSNLTVTTCLPALGFAFGAGTIDGPGNFDFHQHTVSGKESMLWSLLAHVVFPITDEIKKCHLPKPVLITQVVFPTLWLPEIVPTQLLQIGNLIVIGAPGEFTTMAGRRLRKKVDKVTSGSVGYNSFVVLAGLSNIYTNYITTKEEYDYQNYEGASTIFGRNTLDAYLQIFRQLAIHLTRDEEIPPGPEAPKPPEKMFSFAPKNLFDSTRVGEQFGDVIKDANANYVQGETVEVKFVSANLQNGITLDSFLYVERQDRNGNWEIVATDANWETKLKWKLENQVLEQSDVVIEWTIPSSSQIGTYRIRHLGISKSLLGKMTPFQGISREFKVGELRYEK